MSIYVLSTSLISVEIEHALLVKVSPITRFSRRYGCCPIDRRRHRLRVRVRVRFRRRLLDPIRPAVRYLAIYQHHRF